MEQQNQNIVFPEEGKVFYIDKDLNWTSFNVVKKIKVVLLNKYKLRKLKVGHAGTLDPLASGLVIVCAGKETKNIEKYQGLEKEYIAEVRLGATTPSFDLETEIDNTYPIEHISRELVLSVLEEFTGEKEQIPPVFSAKNINGKRAYTYARKGKEVEMRPNIIHIRSIELLDFTMPVIRIRVTCSKGTYIRSLARDIGIALRSGGHLINLRRSRIGNFKVEEALKINEFEEMIKNM